MRLKVEINANIAEVAKLFPRVGTGLSLYIAKNAKNLFIRRYLSGGAGKLEYRPPGYHGRDIKGRRKVRSDVIRSSTVKIRSYPLNLHERRLRILPKLKSDIDSQIGKWAEIYDKDTIQKVMDKV